MKNKIIEYLIAAVVISVAFYLFFAFVEFDLNPRNWTFEGRGTCALVSFMSTGLYMVIKRLEK